MIIQTIDDFKTEVYHGTITKYCQDLINGIDINKSNIKTDFGQGFYTTFSEDQAWNFAQRKAETINSSIRNIGRATNSINFKLEEAVVFVYKLDLSKIKMLNGLFLSYKDDKWAEFVYNNRIDNKLIKSNFHNKNKQFDYVFGDVADTNLFPAIKKYSQGYIDFKEFQRQISPYRKSEFAYNQLSFHSYKAVQCLKQKSIKRGGI